MVSENNEVEIDPGLQLSIDEPSGADFGDTPLQDFWCVGAGYEVKGGKSRSGKSDWMRVYFRGVQVEVLESSTPYPFDTSEVSIFYSDPKRTPKRREGKGTNDWEALGESIRQYGLKLDDVMGSRVNGPEGTMPEKMGMKIRLKRVPTLLNVPPDTDAAEKIVVGDPADPAALAEQGRLMKYHDALAPAWKVVEIDGLANNGSTPGVAISTQVNLMDYVLGLADGKSEPEFYNTALDDPEVMKNPSLITQLTERTFVQQMKDLGRLTQDPDTTLHKV